MTRTDIHRPAELVTEDYTYRFARDLQMPTIGRTGVPLPVHDKLTELFETEGRTYVDHHNLGQCDHCGAHIRYVAYMVHNPTGQVLTVGETCLSNRFDRASTEFHTLRKQAELDRQQQRIVKARMLFLADHPEVQFLDQDLAEDAHYILRDMARKLRHYGSLSDGQIRLALKLQNEDRERRERVANEPPKVRIPDQAIGRTTVEGTILGTRWQDNDFGGSLKALVQVQHGPGRYTVWSTVPAAAGDVVKGQAIRWTGTLDRSRNDETHGFLSRPRVAR